MSHTPGPWRQEPTGNPEKPGERVIVAVGWSQDGGVIAADIRKVENARLIAAAPVMRAVLEMIAAKDDWDKITPDEMAAVCEAIRQAKGETP